MSLTTSFFSRMNRLGTQLIYGMDQLLQFMEFNRSIELDYLQIARCLEGMRQRCCRLDHDLQRARDCLRRSESERSVLEVKLKHARHQVEVEMKKRHRAEAELETQERKLQLIYDYLMADSQNGPFTEDRCSVLAAFDGRYLGHSTLKPGKQLSTVEELGNSIVSDISFDHLEDEVDLDKIKPSKGSRRRFSLAPLIQPVIAAKRARPSVTPAPNNSLQFGAAVMSQADVAVGLRVKPSVQMLELGGRTPRAVSPLLLLPHGKRHHSNITLPPRHGGDNYGADSFLMYLSTSLELSALQIGPKK
ncbi:UNVERIFIED_CONTAM: hypothetical protein K2H54_012447, partial [Gekko kuhli]